MNIPGITGEFNTDETLLSKIAGLEDKDLPSPAHSYIFAQPAYITPTITIACHRTKRRFTYNPQEDITPYELAWLTQLFIVASGTHGLYNMDTDYYITKHRLKRHFEIT